MNCAESETRPVLGPAGNIAIPVELRKAVVKQKSKVEKPKEIEESRANKAPSSPTSPALSKNYKTVPSVLKQQDQKILRLNLSLNASCSSDASSDSSHSRASTGKMSRRSVTPIGRKQCSSKSEKVEKTDTDSDSVSVGSADGTAVKKRCSWVTPNSDPCYAAFHDEEWGVPVHDDKKLFELLSLSTALAELTWPAILNKRHIFREVYQDFDPIVVSKVNEKQIVTTGSTASSLLSELKLRGIIANARQILKIMEEYGSFGNYLWGFVNHKPIVSHFRYPRQVPIKTSKADAISKDLVRRGFRGVGPTVVYTFMQVAGMTNDHLISCFRFQECIAADDTRDKDDSLKAKVQGKQPAAIELGLSRAIDDLGLTME
ncbi:unnamed protein product [Ilex paraguariensis]|uniref:DNA-3-methyladenine glycosylase I n=1 Tax=Ilex paraguariensis TaxID=185542 RepID=A0ABC8V0G9_9AQUA